MAELEPLQDGRNARENAMLTAAVVASRVALPAVSVMRSFTIDPLFAWSPDPQLSTTRDYPTWTWQIPPRDEPRHVIKAVLAADQTLQGHGYCGPDDRCAYFLTTLCLATPESAPAFIDGWCDGQFHIPEGATSERGVDFEQCLIPTGYSDSLARLNSTSRKELSDFRKAVRQMASLWLAPE